MILKVKVILSAMALIFSFYACSEIDKKKEVDTITEPEENHIDSVINTGSLDFSKYMAIGNSITAGYQSGALFKEGQVASYPAFLAKQAGVSDFQQPIFGGEGSGGRITWDGTFNSLGSPVFFTKPAASSSEILGRAENINLSRPYNNMGIPGAHLVIPGTAGLGNATDFFDVAVNNSATDAVIAPNTVGISRKNPFLH